jgi:hypothetical protein
VTIEYTAGTAYHLPIALALEFFRILTRCGVSLETSHRGKYSPDQIPRRYRILKRNVFCNFIQVR